MQLGSSISAHPSTELYLLLIRLDSYGEGAIKAQVKYRCSLCPSISPLAPRYMFTVV